jgi:hypothetical protein
VTSRDTASQSRPRWRPARGEWAENTPLEDGAQRAAFDSRDQESKQVRRPPVVHRASRLVNQGQIGESPNPVVRSNIAVDIAAERFPISPPDGTSMKVCISGNPGGLPGIGHETAAVRPGMLIDQDRVGSPGSWGQVTRTKNAQLAPTSIHQDRSTLWRYSGSNSARRRPCAHRREADLDYRDFRAPCKRTSLGKKFVFANEQRRTSGGDWIGG